MLTAALAGCAKVISPGSTRDGYLHLALSEDPLTLDPALITDVSAGALSAKLFDGLVRFDMQGKIRPCLAQSWDIQDGGKIYIFTLRDDVFFHHGRRLISQDVQQSFQRLLDPATASPRRWILERVRAIETPDPRTVRITMEEPFAPFLSLLAMPNAAIIPIEEVQRLGERFGQTPVGTGPFMMERWERDKALVLKCNAAYFEGSPQVPGVEYRIIPDPWAALTEFTQGHLDWMAVGQSHLEEFLSDPKAVPHLKSNLGLNTYYLGYHCSKPPLDNPRVRKALTMAIDREKIATRLMKNRAIQAHGPVPPVLDPEMEDLVRIPYDPAGAREMLEKEGVRDLHLTLYQSSSADTQEILEVVQEYLRQAGVQVQIVAREWSSFKEAVVKGHPDMFFLSWWADYPDPENFLFPNFFSKNLGAAGNKSRFQDAEFDRLIQQARVETDEGRRQELYRQCVRRVVELCPWVFLWHSKEWVITQPWVQGLELGSVYNADKFLTIRSEKR